MASPTASPTLALRKRPHSSIDSSSTLESSGTAPTRILLLHYNALLSSTDAVTHTMRRTLAESFPQPTQAELSITDKDNSTPATSATDNKPSTTQQNHHQSKQHPTTTHPSPTTPSNGTILRAFSLSPTLPAILAHLGYPNLSPDDMARAAECYTRIYFTEGLPRVGVAAGAQALLCAARLRREGTDSKHKKGEGEGEGEGEKGGGKREDEEGELSKKGGMGIDGDGGGTAAAVGRDVGIKKEVGVNVAGLKGGHAKDGEVKKKEEEDEERKLVVAGEGVAVVVLANNPAHAEKTLGGFGLGRLVDAVILSPNPQTVGADDLARAWVQAVDVWVAQFRSTSDAAEGKPLLPENMLVVSRARYDLDDAKVTGAKTCWVRGDTDCDEPGAFAETDLVVEDLEGLKAELFGGQRD